MIERETVVALIEARENLDAALAAVTGLRLRVGIKFKGELDLVHKSVVHANALIHSILDKGR